MRLPEFLVHTILRVRGSTGTAWLKLLDDRLAQLSNTWQLSDIVLMPDLSYNVVAHAQSALYGPVILKCGVDGESLMREKEALRVYSGIGAVRLLAYDESLGALLLERLEPGRSLMGLFPEEDELATQRAAEVISKL